MGQFSTYSTTRKDHHAGGNHALIELTTDGVILTANEAFLKATGAAGLAVASPFLHPSHSSTTPESRETGLQLNSGEKDEKDH